MHAKKLTGSINYLSKESIRSRLEEFIDIIDGYGLIKILADDDAKDVEQQYVQQDVAGISVQTVIGQNYRVNLHEDDSISMTFLVRGTTYERIQGYKQTLSELGFKNRTSYKNAGFGLTLKSTVEINKDANSEDIVKMFSLFDIK